MDDHAKRIDVTSWRKVDDFDELFATEKTPDPPLKQRVAEYAKTCLTKNKLKSCLHSNFPFVNGLKKYQLLKDLPSDVVSGLTVGIMQIPQGMSYILLVCSFYFKPRCAIDAIIYISQFSSKYHNVGLILTRL